MRETFALWMHHLFPASTSNRGPAASRNIPLLLSCLPVLLAGALFSTPAMAADVWSDIPAGSTGTTLSGTLNGSAITLTSTAASMSANPSDYNGYNIWDNAAAANSAQIWPVTAKGKVQVVFFTNSSPSHLTVKFARPLVNPKMLVYSLDNSFVDYSSTRTTGGTTANLAVVKNPGATYNPTTQRLGTLGAVAVPEGCSTASGRGCAVVTFIGTYSQLDMVVQTTVGNNDGVGMQFGVDPDVEASMRPVPTLSQWGLVLMALLLAAGAGGLVHRRQHIR